MNTDWRRHLWPAVCGLAACLLATALPRAIGQEYEYDEYQWHNPADWFGNYGYERDDWGGSHWGDDAHDEHDSYSYYTGGLASRKRL